MISILLYEDWWHHDVIHRDSVLREKQWMNDLSVTTADVTQMICNNKVMNTCGSDFLSVLCCFKLFSIYWSKTTNIFRLKWSIHSDNPIYAGQANQLQAKLPLKTKICWCYHEKNTSKGLISSSPLPWITANTVGDCTLKLLTVYIGIFKYFGINLKLNILYCILSMIIN